MLSRSCPRCGSKWGSKVTLSTCIGRCDWSIRRRSCFLSGRGGLAIAGSSPELMSRVRDGKVTSRPIAGTRRRGADVSEDESLAEELLGDPKERAEHVMLVDLARNDLGTGVRIRNSYR